MFIAETAIGLTLNTILEVTTTIARQTQQAVELGPILQAAITPVRTRLDADRVILYRCLADQNAVIDCESVGPEWDLLLGQMIYAPCFTATWLTRYRQGNTTQITDVPGCKVAPCYVALLDRFQVQANGGVPIFREAGVWGLEEGNREINRINGILDLTRLSAEMESELKYTISLQCFIPYLADALIERRHQPQTLKIHIADNLPTLTTNASYLERIITALLNNACKYTLADKIITITAQTITTGLELQIINSGAEISPAECEHISDKFYRIFIASPTMTRGSMEEPDYH